MSVTYPTQVSQDTWKLVWDAVGGNVPDKNHAVNAAYEVVGFGLGTAFPYGSAAAPTSQPMAAQGTEEEAKKYIQAMAEGKKKAGAVPWLMIIQVVIQVIQQLLKQP